MKLRNGVLALLVAVALVEVDFDQTNGTPPEGTETVPLWIGSDPDSLGPRPQDRPHLIAFFPKPSASPAPAVVICPGGAYATLSMISEGYNMAAWFQSRGVAAFVLRYRLPSEGYRGLVPLHDAQRALRLVRYHADEWHLNSRKIGIMGFSAGGHLASSLLVHFDAGQRDALDPVESESCRPNFALLIYPVISFRAFPHQHSRINLIGAKPDPMLVAYFSSDEWVTPKTPPTCIVVADDDKTVSCKQSRMMYVALQKAGVPSALQEYPRGGHGFGFGHVPPRGPKDWILPVQVWLKTQGFWPDEETAPMGNS